MDGIVKTVSLQKGITVDLEPVRDKLYALVIENLDNGGRGINNIVEKALINPLARYIFDEDVKAGAAITVQDVVRKDAGFELVIS